MSVILPFFYTLVGLVVLILGTFSQNERAFAQWNRSEPTTQARSRDFFERLSFPNFQIMSPDDRAVGLNNHLRSGVMVNPLKSAPLAPHLTVSEPGHNNHIPQAKNKRFISWRPTGARLYPTPLSCHRDRITEIMSHAFHSMEQKTAELQNFYDRCDPSLGDNYYGAYAALAQLGSIKYSFYSNPQMRLVHMVLEDGSRVRGIIAMKTQGGKRPLVLTKCGVMCDAKESPSNRMLLMHLFDESPFNVLLVNNITGTDYSTDNQSLSAGGFEEGMQFLRIAKLLKSQDSTLTPFISSIHTLGISLGSQGVLYSGIFNEFNRDDQGQRLFNSMTALCPVVHLENSIQNVFLNSDLNGSIFNYLAWYKLRQLFGYVPIIDSLLPNHRKPQPSDIPKIIAYGSIGKYKHKDKSWFLPPFENAAIQTPQDLWHINDFSTYKPLVTVPTLVFSTGDDFVVRAEENALLLRQQGNSSGPVQLLHAPRGSHCAFDTAYGWDTQSALLRSFILSNSPEFTGHERIKKQEISDLTPIRLRDYEVHVNQVFLAQPKSSKLVISYIIFSHYRANDQCFGKDPFHAPSKCYRVEERMIPLQRLSDLEALSLALGGPFPQNSLEAEILTRWANTNLSVMNQNEHSINGTSDSPAWVRWTSY